MDLLGIFMDLALKGFALGIMAAALAGAFLNLNQVTFGALLFIGAIIGILYKIGFIEILIEEIA